MKHVVVAALVATIGSTSAYAIDQVSVTPKEGYYKTAYYSPTSIENITSTVKRVRIWTEGYDNKPTIEGMVDLDCSTPRIKYLSMRKKNSSGIEGQNDISVPVPCFEPLKNGDVLSSVDHPLFTLKQGFPAEELWNSICKKK